jgi:hypothetical protein
MPFLRTLIMHPLEEQAAPVCSEAGLPISAKTLGEAVAVAGGHFGVRIVPHDPLKWFRVYGVPGTKGEYLLVDIHVFRGEQMLCPKQDLGFPILESDIVCIGALVC